eukprot:g14181.t1
METAATATATALTQGAGAPPPAALASPATASAAFSSPLPSSVYVNLPFCRRRCFYCDFPIKVVGDRPGAAAKAARPYVDNVVREIRTTAIGGVDRRDQEVHDGGGVKTLFFGGGTPSLCPPELVGLLMETVRECYGIAAGAEISIEMDPGTFDEARLREFLGLGITRVSMGVQSFDADLLEACGRAHSLADVYQAVEVLRKAGLDNFSIDLISGLPKQTVEQWEHTLSEAVSTGAAHISVYDLQVESGTSFGRWFTAGEAPLPEDDICADMYRTASSVLGRAGYDHYEISNYARPGFQSLHNRAYWENLPFLAFGNGAASYVDGHRFSRPRGLPEYGQWVNKLAEEGWAKATGAVVAGGAAAAGSGEVLLGGRGARGEDSDEEKEEGKRPSDEARERDALLDDVMLGFRLKEGLDLDFVASTYGQTAVRRVEQGVAEALRRGWVIRDQNCSNVGSEDGGGSGTDGIGNDGVVHQDVDVFGTRSGTEGMREASSVGGTKCDVDWRSNGSLGRPGVEAGSDGRIETIEGVVGGGPPAGGLGRLRLSDPDGFLFSNSVISSVFCELDGWKRSRQEQKVGTENGR